MIKRFVLYFSTSLILMLGMATFVFSSDIRDDAISPEELALLPAKDPPLSLR